MEEGEEPEGEAEDAEGEGLPFAVAEVGTEVGFAAEEEAIIRITRNNVESRISTLYERITRRQCLSRKKLKPS